MRVTIIVLTAIVFINCKADKRTYSIIQGNDTTTIYSISTQETKSNKIPEKVFRMRKLRSLTIIGMDCDYREIDEKGNDVSKCWAIGEIPAEIQNLKNLEILELRVNGIQELPKEIGSLKKLRKLDLTDNPGLSNIDNVIELENLESLVLFGCYLTKLPNEIGRLKKLKYLGLTGSNVDLVELERIRRALPNCDVKF